MQRRASLLEESSTRSKSHGLIFVQWSTLARRGTPMSIFAWRILRLFVITWMRMLPCVPGEVFFETLGFHIDLDKNGKPVRRPAGILQEHLQRTKSLSHENQKKLRRKRKDETTRKQQNKLVEEKLRIMRRNRVGTSRWSPTEHARASQVRTVQQQKM